MLEKTEGILFRSVRYGDTSVIVKIFTHKFGYLSFIVPGARSSKNKQKGNLLQPMNILELDLYWREQKNLLKLKEFTPAYIYRQLPTDFIKQSIAIFAVEVISKCIKEQEQNEPLYDYLRGFLIGLDTTTKNTKYLPLVFLWKVSGLLGFEPASDFMEGKYFNLANGIFEAGPFATSETLSASDSQLFKCFLEQASSDNLQLNSPEKKNLLDNWLLYFQWHVPDFTSLQSPKILHEVLK